MTPTPIAATPELPASLADRLYDAIEQVLLHYRSDAWIDESGDPLPLVDLLSPAASRSITEGRHQVRLICDAIYNDETFIAAIAAATKQPPAEPSLSGSGSEDLMLSNPMFSQADRLEMASGAIKHRDNVIANLRSRLADNSYEAIMLRNLLARIHGDGGHYVEQHGIDKAIEDADARVVAWQVAAADRAANEAGRAAGPVEWLIEYEEQGIHRRNVCGHNSVADYRHIDPNARSTPLYQAEQVAASGTAGGGDEVARDAARYRWLRDTPWPPALDDVIRMHRNKRWDVEVDAAMKERSEAALQAMADDAQRLGLDY